VQINARHVMHAAAREYQKMGKSPLETNLFDEKD